MMPFCLASQPPEFDEKVWIPGMRSLYEKAGQTPPQEFRRTGGRPCAPVRRKKKDANGKIVKDKDKEPVMEPVTRLEDIPSEEYESYWTEILSFMLDAYNRLCMYSCFRIHETGTPSVDHLVPKSRDWSRAYLWSNFRLASLEMNRRKGVKDHLLDPFDVQDHWFALELATGAVVPGPAAEADPALRTRINSIVKDLALDDFNSRRRTDITLYEKGMAIEDLQVESPFVAQEILRQGFTRSDGSSPTDSLRGMPWYL